MRIDFKQVEENVVANLRGGEKEVTMQRVTADELTRFVRGKLVPGASIGLHKHEDDSETIYILQGQGRMVIDDGEEILDTGDCHYCPKGHSHSLINNGDEDLIFFAVLPKQ